MEIINKYISGALVPISIVLFSIYFFIKLKGRPFVGFKIMMHSIFDKNDRKGNSGIRAVIFALAGTLGVGNIVGVASAIALGGAGAVFWMWISAFLAMILKYSEVVLALLHRRKRKDEYFGGAMYYMKDCFDLRSKRGIGAIFVCVFTVFCLINGFTMGGIIQSNAISESVKMTFNINGRAVGLILAIICAAVFLLNGKSIFSLCEKLVPFVSMLYLLMSFAVIIINRKSLPGVFVEIINDAFSFEAVGGGSVGFLMSKSLRYGTIRGLFSNEAGCGTSPIAHATAKTDEPVKQGMLGIVEVFIDTIVVCSMTAFVILLNKEVSLIHSSNPILMVFDSFSFVLGNFSNVLLTVCVCLFAFATIVCWGYYGKECIYYFNKGKTAEKIYYCIYILAIYYGAFIDLYYVWELADLAVGAMTIMNLFVLYMLRNEVKNETERYYKKSPRKRALKIK